MHLVAVPWARPGSGFTLLFEVAMLTYAKQMPIAPLAQLARAHDTPRRAGGDEDGPQRDPAARMSATVQMAAGMSATVV